MLRKIISFWIALIFISIVSVSSGDTVAELNSQHMVILSGDMIITNATWWNDTVMVITGNLTINSTGALYLRNTTLKLNSTPGIAYCVRIRAGGRLYLDEAVLMSENSTFHYCFQAENATVMVRNSTIRDCGVNSADYRLQGIYLNNSQLVTERARFVANHIALITENMRATIQNSLILNSTMNDLCLRNSTLESVNTSFNKTKVLFADTNSVFNVSWYLAVRSLWSDGSTAPRANIEVLDRNTHLVYRGITDSCGWIRNIVIKEYTQTATSIHIFTPHNISATASGYTGYCVTSIERSLSVTVTIPFSPLSITITHPRTYQSLYAGSLVPVNWTARGGLPPLNIEIDYTSALGNLSGVIVTTNQSNGSVLWRVPTVPTMVEMVTIRGAVTDREHNTASTQVTVFIIPPFYVVITPSTATVHIGETQTFYATAYELSGKKIESGVFYVWNLTGAIGTVRPAFGPNTTTFTATAAGSGALVAIATYNFASISSGLPAIITVPARKPLSVSLVSPRGGERFAANGQCSISWSVANNSPPYNVTISYSLDSGKTYREITTLRDQQRDGRFSYLWRIPAITGSARIKVLVLDSSQRAEDESGDFRIIDATELVVIAKTWLELSGAVDTTLSLPFFVTIGDYLGDPVAGIEVVWSITLVPSNSTKHYLTATKTLTDTNGRATTMLHLGEKVGIYRLNVSTTHHFVIGLPTAFNASAYAGPLAKISLSPRNITLEQFRTCQFNASGYDSYDNHLPELNCTWSLSPDRLGTLEILGPAVVKFSALEPGHGVIKAFCDTVSGSAEINVTGDTSAPAITDYMPHGRNVPLATTISVTFSEEMNCSVTERAFSLRPEIAGRLRWLNGNRTLQFIPQKLLSDSTTYTVTVSTEATDLAGNRLRSQFRWTFTTIDSTPPTWLEVSPAPNRKDVNVTERIKIVFSEPMTRTITETAVSVISSAGTRVSGIFEWSGDCTVMVFIPRQALEYGMKYVVSIAEHACDLAGNRFDGNHDRIAGSNDSYSWSFTTINAPQQPVMKEKPKLLLTTTVAIVFSLLIGSVLLVTYWLFRKKQKKKTKVQKKRTKPAKKEEQKDSG